MQEEQHCVQLFCPVNNLSLTAVLNWFNLKVVCVLGEALHCKHATTANEADMKTQIRK